MRTRCAALPEHALREHEAHLGAEADVSPDRRVVEHLPEPEERLDARPLREVDLLVVGFQRAVARIEGGDERPGGSGRCRSDRPGAPRAPVRRLSWQVRRLECGRLRSRMAPRPATSTPAARSPPPARASGPRKRIADAARSHAGYFEGRDDPARNRGIEPALSPVSPLPTSSRCRQDLRDSLRRTRDVALIQRHVPRRARCDQGIRRRDRAEAARQSAVETRQARRAWRKTSDANTIPAASAATSTSAVSVS